MRWEWITRANPNVIEVLENFPLLKDTNSKQYLLKKKKKKKKAIKTSDLTHFRQFQAEYWNVLDRNREDTIAAWNTWKNIVIKVAKLEAKRAPIKKHYKTIGKS